MLNVKTSYIKGLIFAVAVFGLAGCKSSSKTAQPGPLTPDNVVTEGYADPTLAQTTPTVFTQSDSYTPLDFGTPTLTGADYDDDFKYTDSAADGGANGLIAQLKHQIYQENKGNHMAFQANKDFAASLTLSQVEINPNEPTDVRVRFSIKRNGIDVPYVMAAPVQNRRGKYHGQLSASLQPVSGPQDIVLTLICMDDDDTCSTSVLSFNDKSQQQVRKAFAVFRTGDAQLDYFVSDNGNNGSIGQVYTDPSAPSAFKDFSQLLKNSLKHQNNRRKFPYIQNTIFESATVIYGSSSFAVFNRIKYKNAPDAIMAVFGPLLRHQNDNEVNMELPDPRSVVLKDASNSPFDAAFSQVNKFSLVQNDGHGSIQLMLNFGADQQQDEAVILTISRTAVQLRALND